ncbi:hypothetical protein NBRC116493_17710 [Aurantivibrio infirmus]
MAAQIKKVTYRPRKTDRVQQMRTNKIKINTRKGIEAREKNNLFFRLFLNKIIENRAIAPR